MGKKTLFIFILVLVIASPPTSADLLEENGAFSLGMEEKFPPLIPNSSFKIEERLRKNVDFWIRIYSQLSSEQGALHDAKYIDHVYEVIDFPKSQGKRSTIIKREKKKWRELLLSVHRKQKNLSQLTDEEKHVFELFRDVNEPNKFLIAAHRKRLRFQFGQKDRFLEGLIQSGRFLSSMESVFKREGLPFELTRLPFVESSFNIKARSKVGASGIWQFMRSTGKLFLQVDDVIDERNDPIRATEAAAQLLKWNFVSLKSWPLAVTAYNHGRKGMMRAVQKVGTDELGQLIDNYHGRSFGFASSNFFAELLAAIEVEKNAKKYFGAVERLTPIPFVEVKIPHFIKIRVLIQYLNLDMKTVKELNPALTELVFSGNLLVPSNFALRLPSSYDRFWENYTKIPPMFKLKTQRRSKYGTRTRHIKD